MSQPSSHPVFRFAPSPNGFLHLGHAYSALFTQRAAKAAGGTMLLRIEDIDAARCRPEYGDAIFEDLHWLGLTWPEPVMRQSQRFAAYNEAILRLVPYLYQCFCTRSEIAAAATGTDPEGKPRYPGTCRHLPRAEIEANRAAGKTSQWRLNMDLAYRDCEVRELAVTATDVLFDRQTVRKAEPTRWGDVVIVRKDTPTSYHLAVVVDDAEQRVTHVTRGMDLYHATDIHVLLQTLLGLPSPVYAHHGLITDAIDVKLSKSGDAPALRLARTAGVAPSQIRERLGFPA